MLMHSFTKREKVILIILAVACLIGFYFLAVHYPVKTRLEEIAIEKSLVDEQQMLADAKFANYTKMKNELEEIKQLPENELTFMPEFDNKQTLIYYFNNVFADTAPNLQFSNAKFEGRIASRTVSFNFNADNWEAAKSTLSLLTGTGFRCSMQNLTISPDAGDISSNSLKVSGNIEFYELVN